MSRTARQPARQATIRPDRPGMARLIAGAVTVVAAVAGGISLHALMTVGSWMGLPNGTTWSPALLLDGGAVAWTLAAYVRRAQERPTGAQWAMVAVAAIVSAAANGSVILLGGAITPQRVIGAALSGLAPIWAALAAHQVADLVVAAPAPKPVPTPAAATFSVAPVATVTAPVAPVTPTRPASTPRPVLDDGARVAARQEARRLASEGMSQRQIAERLGASKSSVARWLSEPEAVAV